MTDNEKVTENKPTNENPSTTTISGGTYSKFTGGVGNSGKVTGSQTVNANNAPKYCTNRRNCKANVTHKPNDCFCWEEISCDYCWGESNDVKGCICLEEWKRKNQKLEINNQEKSDIIQTFSKEKKPDEEIVLGKPIGQGGFGKIYQGTWQGKVVAIKEIPIIKIGKTNKEVKFLQKLVKNEHVIEYYDEFQKYNNFYIIMEYAEQGSLKNFIDNNKDNPHNWTLNYNFISQIVKGLKHLHDNQIIHRDLKSDNILITQNNILKLADFGLVKFLDSSNVSISGNQLKGTVRWLAPEVLGGEKHTYQSDIYSLGMVMWEIVVQNTKPFYPKYENDINVIFGLGRDRKNENDEYKDIEKETIPVNIPQDLAEIINKCWDKTPNQRISLTEIENKLTNSEKVIEIVKFEEISTSIQSSSNSSQEVIKQLQLQFKIRDKNDDLKLMISELKTKLRSKGVNPITSKQKQQEREEKINRLFDEFPDNHKQFINYLEAIKTDLSKNLTEEEINSLYQIKQELVKLNNEYSLQAQIIQSPTQR